MGAGPAAALRWSPGTDYHKLNTPIVGRPELNDVYFEAHAGEAEVACIPRLPCRVRGAPGALCWRHLPTGATHMSTLGNIVWLLFGGLFSALGYFLSGLLLCATIVGIPFGLQSFKLALATLAPFGKRVVEMRRANSPMRVLFNVVWLVFFGWEIALSHLFWGIVLCITLIGIPFGKQHFKLIPLALFPFGRDLV